MYGYWLTRDIRLEERHAVEGDKKRDRKNKELTFLEERVRCGVRT
jgi:hypothetical protein